MKLVQPHPSAAPREQQSNGLRRTQFVRRLLRAGIMILLLLASFLAGLSLFATNGISTLQQMFLQAQRSLLLEPLAYRTNGLPNLYLDLAFEDYQKILDKREEAMRVGILLTYDEDMVPGTLRLGNGDTQRIDIRLKGDWTDHLKLDKWSFRIHIKDGGQILGMRRFSIQAPETREFLMEWAFHRNLMQEGLLTTRYSFANVTLNGDYKGIYAVEESFAEELLESQGRRQGLILRFNEDPMWANQASFTEAGGNQLLDMAIAAGFFEITDMDTAEAEMFRASHVLADANLEAEAATALGLLQAFQRGERTVREVFDLDQLGRFFALSDLWGAAHTTRWHNIRFYYNPITARLEPIGFDALPLEEYWTRDDELAYAFLDSPLFDDPELRRIYAAELERVSQPAYLEQVQAALEADYGSLRQALRWEYLGEELAPPWGQLKQRALFFRTQLHPAQMIRGSYTWSADTDLTGLNVELSNLMVLPVEITALEIGGETVVPHTDWASAESHQALVSSQNGLVLDAVQPAQGSNATVWLHVPADAFQVDRGQEQPLEVYAVTRIYGLTNTQRVPLLPGFPLALSAGSPLPPPPEAASLLAAHPYLETIAPALFRVQPGDWTVNGDLVLPEGASLHIPAGTTLRFGAGAVLLLRGGELALAGNPQAPVQLTAAGESWGGIVVLNAPEVSHWEYATVEKTNFILRDGWRLTGGITFYRSPLALDHVRLLHSLAEDTLNVVHSTYTFENTEFAFAASDGFDADFADGTIFGCSFHDIRGDGVDISGSELEIRGAVFTDILDKGISAGEQSTVTADDLAITTTGIGIASKDLSSVFVSNTQIRAAQIAGLTAYIKKPVFGPAQIQAEDIQLVDTAQATLVQTGSTIFLDGQAQPTSDFDVDRLYEQGILGK